MSKFETLSEVPATRPEEVEGFAQVVENRIGELKKL